MTKNNKIVSWDYSELQSYDDSVKLYAMTEQQATALLAVVVRQMTWRTRWYNVPQFNIIDNFTSELSDTLMQPVDLCELIATCITENDNVRDAINQASRDNAPDVGTPNEVGGNSVALGTKLVDNKCDQANFFAAVTGLVDLLNDLITDIFESIEAATSGLERTTIMMSAIPIFETLPSDEILEFVDNELENLAQAYDGAYTVALRDEYRCDLFCLYKEDCTLSLGEVAEYFAQRASADFFDLTFEEAFSYFLTGSAQGQAVSHAAHYLVMLALSYASRVLSFTPRQVAKIIQALSNDSDNDYAILCGCSGQWSQTFDFELSEFPAKTNINKGSYASGTGFVSVFGANPVGAGNDTSVQVLLDIPDSTTVTEIQVEYNRTIGTNPIGVALLIEEGNGTELKRETNYLSGSHTVTIENVTLSSIRVFIRSSAGDNSGTATLKRIIFIGTGINPF